MRAFSVFFLLLSLLITAHAAETMPNAPAAATSTAKTNNNAANNPQAASDTDDATAAEPGPWIYMVVRIKLTGTDLTQVTFFRHNAIATMEACEAERNAGLTTGWNYFSRYYLKTLKGVPYKVDYRCVEGEQHLTYWHDGVPYDNFYLVQTGDNKLKVQSYRNFFECREALRAIKHGEDIDNFCAISAQAVIKEKS